MIATIEGQEFPLGVERTFKSGSRGFHANGKLVLGEKRYQVNIILTEIGSKPRGE